MSIDSCLSANLPAHTLSSQLRGAPYSAVDLTLRGDKGMYSVVLLRNIDSMNHAHGPRQDSLPRSQLQLYMPATAPSPSPLVPNVTIPSTIPLQQNHDTSASKKILDTTYLDTVPSNAPNASLVSFCDDSNSPIYRNEDTKSAIYEIQQANSMNSSSSWWLGSDRQPTDSPSSQKSSAEVEQALIKVPLVKVARAAMMDSSSSQYSMHTQETSSTSSTFRQESSRSTQHVAMETSVPAPTILAPEMQAHFLGSKASLIRASLNASTTVQSQSQTRHQRVERFNISRLAAHIKKMSSSSKYTLVDFCVKLYQCMYHVGT